MGIFIQEKLKNRNVLLTYFRVRIDPIVATSNPVFSNLYEQYRFVLDRIDVVTTAVQDET